MEETLQLLKELLEPGEEFTPIPFWFLNDMPKEEKIRAQLMDYVEKGVNGFVLHPRIGVPESVPYLSEEYFQAVRFIVDTASGLGMKVVLYDEGMYPSGSAHGMVAAANQEYASKGITLRKEPAGGTVLVTLSGERHIVYDFTGGTIRGIHFGEDDAEPGAPKSADILNPRAVEEFIRLTHERYYQELEKYFGNTVVAFFTDEPCALGRNAGAYREWVPGMEQEIREQGGCLEELEGLFTGQDNHTVRIYHRLIKRHLRETFYARLSKWCEEHGIALMGHPAESDDIEEELYFHIPGQDLIMRRVAPETGGLREPDSVQAKLSADIARLLGRRRNANECFGVCCRDGIPWYFTGRDMKWYINWLGMRGVNLFVPHAFYYSVEGARSGERPPDVGPNNIWWPYYRYFSDYMKRLSYLMTDAQDCARVAVLCDNNHVPCQEIACLYERQITFRYLPVGLLGEGSAAQVDTGAYAAVVNLLEDKWDAYFPQALVLHGEEEVRRLAWEQEGAWRAVCTEEDIPYLRAVHLRKYGKDMYLLCNEGEDVIHTVLTLPGKALPVQVNLWEGSWQLAAEAENASDGLPEETDGNGAVGNEAAGSEDIGNEAAGSRTAGSGGVGNEAAGRQVALHLEPCETVLFLPDETGCILSYGAGTDVPEEFLQSICAGERQVYIPLALELEYTVARRGKNRITYTAQYTTDRVQGGESVTLYGEEMAECCCNGTFAGVSFLSPHVFRVGDLLREGKNTIEITYTGNAANVYNEAMLPFGHVET